MALAHELRKEINIKCLWHGSIDKTQAARHHAPLFESAVEASLIFLIMALDPET